PAGTSPRSSSEKLDGISDVSAIGSENVALIAVPLLTLVAPLTGVNDTNVGRVVSGVVGFGVGKSVTIVALPFGVMTRLTVGVMPAVSVALTTLLTQAGTVVLVT